MAVGLRWHGAKFARELRHATGAGVRAAATHYGTLCKNAVRVSARVGTRKALSGPNKGKSIPVYEPAPRGLPPRRRTGFGSKNILTRHDKTAGVSKVGIIQNALYMIVHEVRGRGEGLHPWLIPTLKKNSQLLGRMAVAYSRRRMK